jgi:hypothetical protein
MSKLSDYSKFDHLDEDDSDEEQPTHQHQQPEVEVASASPSLAPAASSSDPAPAPAAAAPPPVGGGAAPEGATTRKDETTGRFVFEYNGHPVYEWEQTLDDVTIYITAPPFVTKGNQLNCIISARHLKLGRQQQGSGSSPQQDSNSNHQWFLNEDTFGTVDVSESTWSLEPDDGKKIITIYLIKAHRGELWEAALRGNQAASSTLDPMAKEQVKKDMMLERFQEENPGMDFRGAEFNGSVPDARTFMDGVKYR